MKGHLKQVVLQGLAYLLILNFTFHLTTRPPTGACLCEIFKMATAAGCDDSELPSSSSSARRPSAASIASSSVTSSSGSDGGRELFEACRTGEVAKVMQLVNSGWSVNMRDTAGRKSSPLHFAAGKNSLRLDFYIFYISSRWIAS